MFRFTIRELVLLTLVVAMGVAWWLDRRSLAIRAQETNSYRALSEVLTQQLQDQNPAASIEINVNGGGASISRGYAAPVPNATGPVSTSPNSPQAAALSPD